MASFSPSSWPKRLLLGFLLLLLLAPAVQTRLQLFDVGQLGGYAEKAPHPDFTTEALLVNTYQNELEHYVEDRIGFREWLIRLHNQLAYLFFDVAKANNVLIGHDNVLLDQNALLSHLGRDFVGSKEVNINVRKFKAVQDTLAKRGVLLVFAVAPGKGDYYFDHAPDYFQRQPRTINNYTAYVQEMQARDVNVLDLASLFRQWKDTTQYPLFPRGGIHWSGYGITLAADTLFRYLEQHGHFDLPDFRVTGREVVNKTRDSDNDIAKAMNLLAEPAPFRMAYPTLEFAEPKPGQQKPDLLLVADSFGWGLVGFYPYIPNLFGSNTQFWYYNNEVQYGRRDDMPLGNPLHVYQLELKAELLSHPVILVLYTEPNLVSFNNNFSANAYSLFFPFTPAEEAQIHAIEQHLKQRPGMQDSLWQEAYNSGRDYNGLLHEKAVRLYERSL